MARSRVKYGPLKYQRVHVESIGYELPSVVVSTEELEERLDGAFRRLGIPRGQVEAWTGIQERRWWPEGASIVEGSLRATRKALERAGAHPRDVDVLLYAGVCREVQEPATACSVAAGLGVRPETQLHDVSNACLGVLSGMVEVANRIELGQARLGVVTSCETAREIVEDTLGRLASAAPSLEGLKEALATLTGGSGAVAVVLSDGTLPRAGDRRPHRLLGGASLCAPEHHGLCRWGFLRGPEGGYIQSMVTDSVAVLKHGVELGRRTWAAFQSSLGWSPRDLDKVICHQVGSSHQESILAALSIDRSKDFSTFPFLGNIGTVSLPLSAALAEERGFLSPGDRVGLLGIGSGLNCLMLGLQW